jgi:hypothetical protein
LSTTNTSILVQLLLELKAFDPNARVATGEYCLEYSIKEVDATMRNIFLEYGANPFLFKSYSPIRLIWDYRSTKIGIQCEYALQLLANNYHQYFPEGGKPSGLNSILEDNKTLFLAISDVPESVLPLIKMGIE